MNLNASRRERANPFGIGCAGKRACTCSGATGAAGATGATGATGIGFSQASPTLVGIVATPILPTMPSSQVFQPAAGAAVHWDAPALAPTEERTTMSVIDDAKDLLKETKETATSLLTLGVFGAVAYLLLR